MMPPEPIDVILADYNRLRRHLRGVVLILHGVCQQVSVSELEHVGYYLDDLNRIAKELDDGQ